MKAFPALLTALALVPLATLPAAGAADPGQPASLADYLAPVVVKLEKAWPKNQLVNVVFHGHSVPAGYFKTPTVDSLHAYPNLLRESLAERFPHAVVNVIVTAVGGEDSVSGAARFDADVLTLKPDVLFIDYALNDRRMGLERAKVAWTEMIQKALAADIGVLLLTPTPDQSSKLNDPEDPLNQHAEQIRRLAAEYHVGLVDSLARFKAELAAGTPLKNLMAQVNHPNAAGHKLVAEELVKWFPPVESGSKITVASYYFGNYHPNDPRNEMTKGKGWSEWELVKAAKPRFPMHQQPKVPLWGYTDESDPRVMEQKIAAAADHGIDAFIFDWYYYNDGPFLERPIDRGFLKAANNSRIRFAFMWANHDWEEIHPYKRGTGRKVLYPGKVTPENFGKICDHVIKDYFSHPSYWKIDGKPYFSFYELTKLLENFGSVEAARAALDQFRAKATAAGLPGLHLNAVVWGKPILPAENAPADPVKLVKDLGFDSVTSYVWIHHVPLPQMQTDYNEVRDAYFKYWDEAARNFGVPYYPNVTMGWDPSPRAHQDDPFGNFGYPFMNTIGGNTPERFKEALELTRQRLLANPNGPRVLNINCWNEWTEGSYLEPDIINGMKYLEAVQTVFGASPKTK